MCSRVQGSLGSASWQPLYTPMCPLHTAMPASILISRQATTLLPIQQENRTSCPARRWWTSSTAACTAWWWCRTRPCASTPLSWRGAWTCWCATRGTGAARRGRGRGRAVPGRFVAFGCCILCRTACSMLFHAFWPIHSFAKPLLLDWQMAAVAAPHASIACCRLKSAQGNKTISALTSLNCQRRVILTGTPIQNGASGGGSPAAWGLALWVAFPLLGGAVAQHPHPIPGAAGHSHSLPPCLHVRLPAPRRPDGVSAQVGQTAQWHSTAAVQPALCMLHICMPCRPCFALLVLFFHIHQPYQQC